LKPGIAAGNRSVKVDAAPRLLLEMLEQFPAHDNDDLPNALQMAVEL
jgi:hypothetical protein